MSRHVIERDQGRAPVIINAPADRALASLWELAQLEFEAQGGAAPATKAEWDTVTDRYHALVSERRSELGHVVREIRESTPDSVDRRIPAPIPALRPNLTPFAEQLAALLKDPVTIPV